MTGKKIRRIILLIIAALLIAAALIYTRPMTIAQHCPGLDLSECQQIRGYYHDGTTVALVQFILEPEDPAFAQVMELFEGRTFRRSLRSLLPQGTRTHRTQEGDFQWEVYFRFEQVPLPDGSTVSGDILQFNNFYGELDLSFDGDSWRVTTSKQKQWLTEVMKVITP